MPRAFLIKNKKHPPPGTQQPAAPGGEAADGWALEDRPAGDEDCYPVDEWEADQEDRMEQGDEDDDVLDVVAEDDEEDGRLLEHQERHQQHTRVPSIVSSMVDGRDVDVTSIYPSPSPSSEESLCPRDDTSISSSDDEPRDVRASRNDVTRCATSPDMRRANSLSSDESPVSSPGMTWPHMTSRPLVIIPSPRTSPEPEADDDCLDRSTPSPKRRRSDGDDDMGMTSRLAHDDVTLRHQDGTAMTSSANCVPRGGMAGSRESSFWQSHLAAGMGLGLSMAVHHPYLALSFQRLQQLHLRAAQEGLPKLSPFHPHLPLAPPPPHHHPHHPHHPGQTSPLPFAPLPPVGPPAGLQVPMPTSGSRPGSQATPSSPVQGCSSDYPFPPHARMEQQHHADFPTRASPKHSPTGSRTVILPHVIQPTSSPPGGVLESLPLDLDTKTPAEKRKRREGEPPRYNCEACGKTYSTFSGLSKHKQFHCTSHVQKQFNCKYCDKTYVSLGALKMHIRTHTLPCKCHLCGKAFSRPWLLQGHVRTHTGEKPFQCAHCGRSFADRSNLRAHLQTHSEVKKYNCRTCSKTFSRMSLLLKHEDGGCAGMVH